MDSTSASNSDSDPEWKEEEEEEEEEEDYEDEGKGRPARVPASARSATFRKETVNNVAKMKGIQKFDKRTRGKKRKMKKCDQLFRHKLLLPDNYLAFAYPPPLAAAATNIAEGSVGDGDGNALLHDGDRDQQRARRRGEFVEKLSKGDSGNFTEKIIGNSKRRSSHYNHQKTTAVVDDQGYHFHQQNGSTIRDCNDDGDDDVDSGDDDHGDESVNITSTTNTVDIDLVGKVGIDDDDNNYQHYNQQKRQHREKLEMQSRNIPFPGNVLFWSCSDQSNQSGGRSKRPSKEGANGTLEESTNIVTAKQLNRLHSFRRRIERADVIIQSKAPSYIEFRAMRWGERNTCDGRSQQDGVTPAPVAASIVELATKVPPAKSTQSATMDLGTDDTAATSVPAAILPSQNAEASDNSITRAINNVNRIVDYRTQQSFFSLPPCLKSYGTTKLAQEFLAALHNAAVDASATTTTTARDGSTLAYENSFGDDKGSKDPDAGAISPSALGVTMEFITIIAESRLKPQDSPFCLMKKVWTLILSLASQNKNGTLLAQNLASRFDAFLPDGYSMMSCNLLFLQDQGNVTTSMDLHHKHGMETPTKCDVDFASGESNDQCARMQQFLGREAYIRPADN